MAVAARAPAREPTRETSEHRADRRPPMVARRFFLLLDVALTRAPRRERGGRLQLDLASARTTQVRSGEPARKPREVFDERADLCVDLGVDGGDGALE